MAALGFHCIGIGRNSFPLTPEGLCGLKRAPIDIAVSRKWAKSRFWVPLYRLEKLNNPKMFPVYYKWVSLSRSFMLIWQNTIMTGCQKNPSIIIKVEVQFLIISFIQALFLLLQSLLQPPAMTQACPLTGPAAGTAGSRGIMWCSSVIRVTSCREPKESSAPRSMAASSGSQTHLHAQVVY